MKFTGLFDFIEMKDMNNRYYSIGYKIVFIVLCLWGLSLHLGLWEGEFRWRVLNYYTLLSNLICLIYMIWGLSLNYMDSDKNAGVYDTASRIEAGVVFCITITMLIYNFILAPIQISMGLEYKVFSVSNILLHYILPTLMILDWLLFARKGAVKQYDPFIWLSIPYLYFIFILIRAHLVGVIPRTKSPYPYQFMDVDALGWEHFFINAAGLTLFFLVVGYMYWGIDYFLRKLVMSKVVFDEDGTRIKKIK